MKYKIQHLVFSITFANILLTKFTTVDASILISSGDAYLKVTKKITQ